MQKKKISALVFLALLISTSTHVFAATTVTVNNNAGIPCTVKATGLVKGDIIKVYDLATGGKLLGTATADTTGIATASLAKTLGASAGTVYVSVTTKGSLESTATGFGYFAKTVTPSL